MTDGRIIFITGASSGIGYASALAFAQRGDHVVALARRRERLTELETVVNGLPAAHGMLLALAGDVRTADEVEAAAAQAVERFGRIDVLVANAGIGQRGGVVDADWDDLHAVLQTNIDGVLHTVRAVVPIMRRGGGGHIITVSSVTATMPLPYAATYAASKAFVSSLAHSLRAELESDRIGVTDMRVGRTVSEFNEKRLGASGRASSRYVRSMPTERVAAAVVHASLVRPHTVTLRWIDRLIVAAGLLVPGLIGRLAKDQYKVEPT